MHTQMHSLNARTHPEQQTTTTSPWSTVSPNPKKAGICSILLFTSFLSISLFLLKEQNKQQWVTAKQTTTTTSQSIWVLLLVVLA